MTTQPTTPNKPAKSIWFKANPRGNGWKPATWQGWLVWILCIGLNLAAGILLVPQALHDWTLWLAVGLAFLVINAGFMWVCSKTGEPIQFTNRSRR